MAIAQMNWGRLLHPLSDPRMEEFAAALAHVYHLAETHDGFVWRVPDDAAASQLGSLGFDDKTSATVSVWDSVDALREIRQNPTAFDLVITDQTMPKQSGTELAAAIREIKPDLPVILYSGRSEQVSDETIRDSRIKAFLKKPIDIEKPPKWGNLSSNQA